MNGFANARPATFDRRFYLGASAVFLALVFWVFARSYYLKVFFDAPRLPLLLHIHGAVMSGWVVLLMVQSSLIAARRVRWHRQLGAFGAAWAVLVVILGSTTTVHAAAREVRGHTARASMQLTITGLELVQMLLFAGLVAGAIWLRRRTDYHKRLMLLTIVCMLPSVIGRLPVSFMSNLLILSLLDLFVVSCVGTDSLRNRRLHPAFGWGASLTRGALHLAFLGAYTHAWRGFGTWLLS